MQGRFYVYHRIPGVLVMISGEVSECIAIKQFIDMSPQILVVVHGRDTRRGNGRATKVSKGE